MTPLAQSHAFEFALPEIRVEPNRSRIVVVICNHRITTYTRKHRAAYLSWVGGGRATAESDTKFVQ